MDRKSFSDIVPGGRGSRGRARRPMADVVRPKSAGRKRIGGEVMRPKTPPRVMPAEVKKAPVIAPPLPENSPKRPKKSRKKSFLSQKSVDKYQRRATRNVRRFIFSRVDNLRNERRTVLLWTIGVALSIVLVAVQFYFAQSRFSVDAAASGGTYAEGTTDAVANFSPLFATTNTERAMANLVYRPLLRLDAGNRLRGDVATSWSVNNDGKEYTVKLRSDLQFSDGDPLNADDVVFTVGLIKNPATQSPLYESWRTITIVKISDTEVKFTLPNAYASFPFALSFGVLPEHILSGVPAEQLLNYTATNAAAIVGAGPFAFRTTQPTDDGQAIWRFTPNEQYAGAAPRVRTLTIQTFATADDMAEGLEDGEINVAAGLTAAVAANSLSFDDTEITEVPSMNGVFALFNNGRAPLNDVALRQALTMGLNRDAVRQSVTIDGQLAVPTPLDTPLARGVNAQVDALKQPDFDAAAAAKALDDAGWTINTATGFREKDGQSLTLSIVVTAGSDTEMAANNLTEQWRSLGIDASLTAADATTIQQNHLLPRSYDVLVYELYLGPDPDVFAYWSSSQTGEAGLNFANYDSRRADLDLTQARTELNATDRADKYLLFAEQWLADQPAIALYQPNYYYLKGDGIETLTTTPIASPAERFREVTEWTVLRQKALQTP